MPRPVNGVLCDPRPVRPERDDIAIPPFPPGITWIGAEEPVSERLTARAALLVHFFELGELSSIRTLPFVSALARKYAANGLSVLGVHSPRSQLAASDEALEAGLARLDVGLPGRQRQRAPGLALLRLPGLAVDLPLGARRDPPLRALRRGRLPRDRGGDPRRAGRRRGARPARAGPRAPARGRPATDRQAERGGLPRRLPRRPLDAGRARRAARGRVRGRRRLGGPRRRRHRRSRGRRRADRVDRPRRPRPLRAERPSRARDARGPPRLRRHGQGLVAGLRARPGALVRTAGSLSWPSPRRRGRRESASGA